MADVTGTVRLVLSGVDELLPGVGEFYLSGVDELLPGVGEFYRDLHRHPELSGQEERTAGLVAGHLLAAGCMVTEGVGGYGVVGVLANGPGPVVGIRGDMDALPVQEETGLPYASRNPGVMHACGHDLHTACLTGTAQLLAAHREHWSGTLLVIAQPSEESISGAEAMLADGLFTEFPRRFRARTSCSASTTSWDPPAWCCTGRPALRRVAQLPGHHPRARGARRDAAGRGGPGAHRRAGDRRPADDRVAGGVAPPRSRWSPWGRCTRVPGRTSSRRRRLWRSPRGAPPSR